MTLQGMAKHIELWLIDKLIPYARNPRTHSDAQIAQIAASIAEFGFNSPILVDCKAGIIAGHGRLLAARGFDVTGVERSDDMVAIATGGAPAHADGTFNLTQ